MQTEEKLNTTIRHHTLVYHIEHKLKISRSIFNSTSSNYLFDTVPFENVSNITKLVRILVLDMYASYINIYMITNPVVHSTTASLYTAVW